MGDLAMERFRVVEPVIGEENPQFTPHADNWDWHDLPGAYQHRDLYDAVRVVLMDDWGMIVLQLRSQTIKLVESITEAANEHMIERLGLGKWITPGMWVLNTIANWGKLNPLSSAEDLIARELGMARETVQWMRLRPLGVAVAKVPFDQTIPREIVWYVGGVVTADQFANMQPKQGDGIVLSNFKSRGQNALICDQQAYDIVKQDFKRGKQEK